MLPRSYSELLKSYLHDRKFRARNEDALSSFRKIEAGVPQGSVLGPTLYLLFTADIPMNSEVRLATFADDTAILATGNNTAIATDKLQRSINQIVDWTKRWRIKLNESKSQHINFTLKKETPLSVTINQQVVPYANTAKYLGMTLDAKLRWKEHIKIKRKQLNKLRSSMEWMIGRKSKLSIHNKLLLYKQILKPVWTYGIQLWGCSANSNIKIIQSFQNKVLRDIVNAPWYCHTSDIHCDLQVCTVAEERVLAADRHRLRLANHTNRLATRLLNFEGKFRRLKRTKPSDFMSQ